MTASDGPVRGRARLATGLFAFLVTLLVGGGGGMLLVAEFKANVENAARRDVSVIGGSLARSLSTQFEKAARYGIPLKLIPGVEAYLSQTLNQTPGIARIVVRGPDGREVRSAVGPLTGTDTVSAPISVDGLAVGQVDVTTSPIAFSGAFQAMELQVAAAAFVCAVLAGIISGYVAGGSLDRRRRRLATALAHNAAGELDAGPPNAAIGRSPVAQAFDALSRGTRRVSDKWAAFQAYAEELLAVDFDGRLRPEVERIRREAMPRDAAPREATVRVNQSERGA
ncbi:hypothetical protein GCM10007301_56450 [Azorhizobium oxalatiphilum]|uniref:Uncharacterized protein n=1 Tax=Azorhizobium oxalatiphilum TaxID=980631 RepID=A0A917CHJ1_9HYPH|nr:hypothetical protein [Azorhizobium oxalatiphilum]GGF89243.1 hypothetical protein GCM10007301_56450 [Azorhizobium oxalatiphilum]